MKKTLFEREMNKARSMQRADHNRASYWMGYQRGLRRRFHGTDFGTEEEHHLWLTADGDESRIQRSSGYRDGFYGPDKSIQIIRQWRGWTPDEMGEHIGKSGRTVQGYEAGKPLPKSIEIILESVYTAT